MDWRPASLIDFYVDQGTDPTLLDYLTAASAIVGLIVATISLVIALKSAKAAQASADRAQQSLETAQQALRISQEQHDVFLEERNARSDLRITATLMGSTYGNLTSDATSTYLRWEILIKNMGNRLATNIGVNVVLPAMVRDVKWTDQQGAPAPDRSRGGPVAIPLKLEISTGELDAVRMDERIASLGPHDRTTEQRWIMGLVDLPPNMGEVAELPIRVCAWCDEQPEANLEDEKGYVFTLTKGNPDGPPG